MVLSSLEFMRGKPQVHFALGSSLCREVFKMKHNKTKAISYLLVAFLLFLIPISVSADNVDVGSGVTRTVSADLSGTSNSASSSSSSSSGTMSHEEAQNAANIQRYNSSASNILSNYIDGSNIANLSPNNGSQYINAQLGEDRDWFSNAYWYGNTANYKYNYSPYSSNSSAYSKAKKYINNTLSKEYGMNYNGASYNWPDFYNYINTPPYFLPSAFYYKGLDNKQDSKAVQELLKNYNKKLKSLSSTTRNINGLNICDFSNNKNRQQALYEYAQAYQDAKDLWGSVAVDETVKVVLVKELNIEDTKHSVLYSSQSTNWPGFGKPIQVEYKYISKINNNNGEIGIAAQTQYANNGEKITMYPMKPGKYEWTQTQVYDVTYADVMSYTYNQYLVIADTGQVVWSKTSVGPTNLDYSKSGKDIENVDNPYVNPFVTFYNKDDNVRNVYDIKKEMEYVSNTIVDTATEKDINNGGISRSAFSDNFLTFRVD